MGGPQRVQVGIDLHRAITGLDPDERAAVLARVEEHGLDHVGVGDHVSFHDGTGFDGLIASAVALAGTRTTSVSVGIYQLALRHPLTVARQLHDLERLAPGRLVLGVGVGGEDRREVSNCGVDPSTRGKRVDESLGLLRRLLSGEVVDHEGEFFTLEGASIADAKVVPPVLVGGRGDAMVRRVVEHGDGWLGLFVSPRRYGQAVEQIRAAAADTDRDPDRFALSVWCAFGGDAERAQLFQGLADLYRAEEEALAPYVPVGSPAELAAFLRPYRDAGCTSFTIMPGHQRSVDVVDQVAELAELLAA
ncbi:MAG: oxidoreductase [Frankiales bacterium]|nr:oxidoreductase [Frankiales bacterium]